MNYIKELKPLIIFSKGIFTVTGDYYGSYGDPTVETIDMICFGRGLTKELRNDLETKVEEVIIDILDEQGKGWCQDEGSRGDYILNYNGKKLSWKFKHVEMYIEERDDPFEGTYNEPSTSQSK